MAYLASAFIKDSYHLSHIVARQIQTLTADESETGLRLLNVVLANESIDGDNIPYFSGYTVAAVPGQEGYFIPGLIECELFTYDLGSVRLPSMESTRRDYFATAKAKNVNSLPYKWHIERSYEAPTIGAPKVSGSRLYVTFSPNQNYPFTVWGKFALTNVTMLTDLTLIYDPFYLNYLRHALAVELCKDWNVPVTPELADGLKELQMRITRMSSPDLTPKTVQIYEERNLLNYAQINVGQGYVPL